MCEEELDETAHWLDLIIACDIMPKERMQDLYNENLELVKIIVASIKTMRTKIENE